MITTINEYKRINESKNVGIIYHFTDIYSIKDITNYWSEHNPSLKFSKDDIKNKNEYFISTTRKFDFVWNPIRLTLDGNKISQRFKIVPLEYFKIKPEDYRNDMDENQHEERIITNNPNIKLELLKYCLSVDVALLG